MSIQSKSARILAVISVLALASACGEGAESAEQQESPAQMAPDALKEQEAALAGRTNCYDCKSDFWGVNANGMAGGWACSPSRPNSFWSIVLYKRVNGALLQIGEGRADRVNGALSSVCGGSPYHQFKIPVGAWNGGPGEYVIHATTNSANAWLFVDTFYK